MALTTSRTGSGRPNLLVGLARIVSQPEFRRSAPAPTALYFLPPGRLLPHRFRCTSVLRQVQARVGSLRPLDSVQLVSAFWLGDATFDLELLVRTLGPENKKADN